MVMNPMAPGRKKSGEKTILRDLILMDSIPSFDLSLQFLSTQDHKMSLTKKQRDSEAGVVVWNPGIFFQNGELLGYIGIYVYTEIM